LNNKLTTFQNFVYTFDYDIIGLTETWLTDAVLDNEILPVNYSIYRTDRVTRGGGVLLAVKNTVPSQCWESPKDLELVTVVISLNNPVKICLVYNPPNSSLEYKIV